MTTCAKQSQFHPTGQRGQTKGFRSQCGRSVQNKPNVAASGVFTSRRGRSEEPCPGQTNKAKFGQDQASGQDVPDAP
jgi:hypothetical protein